MADAQTFTITEDDDGIRLDRWFKRHKPEVSFTTVAKWARTGQLRLNGKRATPGDRIETGQEIRIPPVDSKLEETRRRVQPKREQLTPDEIEFVQSLVIAERPEAFVLNKPPGLATQGGTKTRDHLDRLLEGLADDGARPKLVHRLDKDTSGAILVARSSRAAGFFSKAFSGRTARKIYWALVAGVPSTDEGLIDAPLTKQPGTGGEKMHIDEENGLPANTRWRVLDRAGNRAAWVELQPLTGRTHQLRAHMAAIGHPIVGDGKYAGPDAFLTGGLSRKLHLHARRLKIDSPDGVAIDVTAELPEHFRQSLETLGFEIAAGNREAVVTPQRPKLPPKPRRDTRRGERRSRTGKKR